MRGHGVWIALLPAFLMAGCTADRRGTPGDRRPTVAAPTSHPADAPFVDVTEQSGIRFEHITGGRPPLNILETAGTGCGLFDFDGDGLLDLFLVNGRYRDGRPEVGQPRHALYRNNGDGTFTDVTQAAGIGSGYGMGCAVADVDGDGRLDLYVTQYGANLLYLNNGDGTFTDVTQEAGVAAGGWSTSAAFADYDSDGDLDLYVTRYLVFTPRSRQLCDVEGVRLACPPRYYEGQSGILYRNDGPPAPGRPPRFTDVSAASGVRHPQGKGLGCLWFDADGDGDLDLYLANDGVSNNFYRNDGNGTFTDIALVSGTAYGPTGNAEASMGVDAGDYNGDGRFDLFIGNFQNETSALYRNEGNLFFTYATAAAGLAEATLPLLTFGVVFVDYDNDGLPDLFAANGHVQDAIARVDPLCEFPQPCQLFRNAGGGRFEDVSATAPAITAPMVGRGVAFGDWDNDGDVDLLVTGNGGPPRLLQNQVGDRNGWLTLRLVGRGKNRHAVGARVRLRAGDRTQLREVRSGGSYASASDFRLTFGLGESNVAEEIEIRWPDGVVTRLRHVRGNRLITVRQTE